MPQDVYIYDPYVPVPKNVRYVEIPEGITTLRDFSFANCSELQSVIIPDSVTKIGDAAFKDCSALQSVTIPDSVTEIGNGAFFRCTGLRSIVMPGSVRTIGPRTFEDCRNLLSIIIPDSVTEIGEYAFGQCIGLQSVTIPDGVTQIDCGVFYGCSGLQSVIIPDGITKISQYSFDKCSGLQSIRIPDGVTEIGDSAFADCAALRSVIMPDSVTKIDDCAFWRCSGLQSVTIPDGITKISRSAFDGCSALQSVTIPDGITEISSSAFGGCSALRSVIIPDGVTKIGYIAFHGCSGLQSVTIPDTVTEIGAYAFHECSGLRSVTIPGSVEVMGERIFRDCSNLHTVTISDGATHIGECAFEGCSNLRSVTIPDSITIIGEEAFRRCDNLRSVAIPDGIVKIRKDAFADCPALQSLMYKGINIAPFINIDGYGTDTFSVIRTLVEHHIPLSGHAVKIGIDMAHQGKLSEWIRKYPVFGTMRLQPATKSADAETEEYLRRLFAAQKKTGCHVPKILDKLAIAVCACGIPPERLAETFDIKYTKHLLDKKIPLVPATACRCYYDRGICDMLARKDKVSVMAEAIGLYNRSGHRECYRYLTDFILSHPDTKNEDLQYATDHAEEIPMRANTTLIQIRQHRIYTESLAEVAKIEMQYGRVIPEFRLSDYPCSIDPVSITYDGMTARVLDLSDSKDIALAARLGVLTNCCQCLGKAGETAMMHGFLNPDAGFWVIEDRNGEVKAQAEIWKTNNGNLIFDNIEFANTDREHLSDRADRLRGVIAAWAAEGGYTNIIMGCGYNELGIGSMEPAPIPELRLTPEEVFALQKDSDAGASFESIDEVRRYMQSEKYRPGDFVYTDADEQCVYIKKDGIVSDYLMQGCDRIPGAESCPAAASKRREEDPAFR